MPRRRHISSISYFVPLFLLRRTEGADEKIAEGLPAVIGEVAGSGAGKRI